MDIGDATGEKWRNSIADAVCTRRDDAARPRTMRLFLSTFEAVRVLGDRVQQLDAGSPPNLPREALRGLHLSEDVARAEWAERAPHARGGAYEMRRALPDGNVDVVVCRGGRWTVQRFDKDKNALTPEFDMEVPRQPPVAKFWVAMQEDAD